MALCAVLASVPATAGAVVLAESAFDADDNGWREGDFTGGNSTHPLVWDADGHVVATDSYGQVAGFLAPSAYLGDQRLARGGTLSFDLASDFPVVPDRLPYVTLRRDGVLLFGLLTDMGPTATFRRFSVGLRPENFFLGNPEDGPGAAPATDALFAQVLGKVTQLSIRADVASGRDMARLDNVVLTAGAPVPEPSTWATMVLGLGLGGTLLRRSRALRAQRA
jgi:hypothetical protein